MNQKSRSWGFVIYEWEGEWLVGKNHLVYACMQKEKCPTTGRLHFQGWLYLDSNMSGAYMKKHYNKGAHFFKCKGTHEENINYCTKLETRVDGPWEMGNRENIKSQGQRTDLVELVKDTLNGMRELDLLDKYGNRSIQYGRAIDYKINKIIEDENKRKDITEMPKAYWYYGNTGGGKTTIVKQIVKDNKYYIKDNTQFWQGYKGEDIIWFDDYEKGKGWEINDFIKLINIIPMRANVKLGGTVVAPKSVYVTSNWKIEDLWNGETQLDAVKRRFEQIQIGEYTKPKDYTTVISSDIN